MRHWVYSVRCTAMADGLRLRDGICMICVQDVWRDVIHRVCMARRIWDMGCLVGRLVTGYGMIGMMRIPKENRRHMHHYTYSMHIC